MKKKYVLLVVAVIVSLLVLSSCGNRQVGIDLSQTFNTAYIKLGDELKILSVKQWRDYDNGDEVQIVTYSGDVYLTHYSNVVLVNSK